MTPPSDVILLLGHDRATFISAEDQELSRFNWYLGAGRYAQMHKGSNVLYLHRVVLTRVLGRELQSDETCDHINGDPLDNRRSNLRLASRSQNQWNRKPGRNSVTGINGVTQVKSGRWMARIQYKGKTITLGRFATQAEAIGARKKAELELFGEFSPLVCRKTEESV